MCFVYRFSNMTINGKYFNNFFSNLIEDTQIQIIYYLLINVKSNIVFFLGKIKAKTKYRKPKCEIFTFFFFFEHFKNKNLQNL